MQGSHVLSDGDTINPASSIDMNDGMHYMLIDGSLNMSEPGVVKFDLLIEGDDARQAAEYGAALKSLLSLAEKRSADYHAVNWVTYILQRGTEQAAYLDVESGTMTLKTLFPLSDQEVWTVELRTLPHFRWDKVELDVTDEMINGDAMLEVLDVPGSIDALVRLEIEDTSDISVVPTNAINRIRGARNSGEGALAADWQPIVNFDSVIDETSLVLDFNVVEDDDSIGDDYVECRFFTEGGVFPAAMFTASEMPSGELNRGERDVWVRAKSVSDPIDLTGTVTATVVDPVITSEAVVTYIEPDVRLIISDLTSAASSPTTGNLTWTGNTTSGSTLVTIITGYGGTSTGSRATTPVAGSSIGGSNWQEYVRENTPAADTYTTWVLFYPNASTINDSVGVNRAWTWSANAAGNNARFAVAMFEISNVEATSLESFVDAYDQALNRQHTLAAVASDISPIRLLAARVIRPGATHVNAITWFNGYQPLLDANGFNVATRLQYTGETPAMSVRSVTEVGDVDLFLMGFRGGVTVLNEEISRVDSGNLLTGTVRTFTVYAVDLSGMVGDSITSDPIGIAYSGSRIELDWTDSGGADTYIVEWTAFGNFYRIYTTQSKATISDEAEAVFANDLPAIVVGQYAGNDVGLVHGTGVDPYPAVGTAPKVTLPADDTFRWVQLATANLPSAGTLLDGQFAPATVYVASAPGGSKDPITGVDALWCVPHTEPQFIAEYPTLTMPDLWPEDAERHWIVESTRRGNAMVGWVQDGDDVVRGSIRITGRMLLAPGDNLISLLCDGFAGQATMDALTLKAKLTYWPRSHWQNWSTAP